MGGGWSKGWSGGGVGDGEFDPLSPPLSSPRSFPIVTVLLPKNLLLSEACVCVYL